jgi:hypothetical protein
MVDVEVETDMDAAGIRVRRLQATAKEALAVCRSLSTKLRKKTSPNRLLALPDP